MGRRILTDAGYEVITVNNGRRRSRKFTRPARPDRPRRLHARLRWPGSLPAPKGIGRHHEDSGAADGGQNGAFQGRRSRRVHADGHIVKPFEASELLSALTKLEDKIVPPENGRGRRGKAETKKSELSLATSAVNFDDSHTEQIQYLARVKNRRPTEEVPVEVPDSPFAQPSANASPAMEVESEAKNSCQVRLLSVVEISSYESAEPARQVAEEDVNQDTNATSQSLLLPGLNTSRDSSIPVRSP